MTITFTDCTFRTIEHIGWNPRGTYTGDPRAGIFYRESSDWTFTNCTFERA